MFKVIEYFNRVQGLRGQMLGLPGWTRVVIFIAALPGIALIALSLLALLVSILALLLLTVPLYRLFRALFGLPAAEQQQQQQPTGFADVFGFPPTTDDVTSPGRKKVDVTIVDG
jgi:hypothetical protein